MKPKMLIDKFVHLERLSTTLLFIFEALTTYDMDIMNDDKVIRLRT